MHTSCFLYDLPSNVLFKGNKSRVTLPVFGPFGRKRSVHISLLPVGCQWFVWLLAKMHIQTAHPFPFRLYYRSRLFMSLHFPLYGLRSCLVQAKRVHDTEDKLMDREAVKRRQREYTLQRTRLWLWGSRKELFGVLRYDPGFSLPTPAYLCVYSAWRLGGEWSIWWGRQGLFRSVDKPCCLVMDDHLQCFVERRAGVYVEADLSFRNGGIGLSFLSSRVRCLALFRSPINAW